VTSPQRAELLRLMAAMASGDRAALFPFVEIFGNVLAAMVRRTLADLGRNDVAKKPEDVDYLVQSAAFVIFDRSSSWRPDGGALPWVWAERAIRAEIVRWLGHPAVEWSGDIEVDDLRAGLPIASREVDLSSLAADHRLVALLLEAVKEVASERDRHVHLEYQIQKGLGDRSPATTVADIFGLSPANVRQIDRRVRQKLQDLIVSDRRFAALIGLRWWAA